MLSPPLTKKRKVKLGFIQKRHDKEENRFRYMGWHLPVRHMALDDSRGWIIFHCRGRRLNSLTNGQGQRVQKLTRRRQRGFPEGPIFSYLH